VTAIRLVETFHTVFYAPLYVAKQLGVFEAEGLEVIPHTLAPGDNSYDALKGGRADMALGGPMRSLVAAEAGDAAFPVSFIEVNSRDGFMLLARRPVQAFRWYDLEGKSVVSYREPPTPLMCLLSVLKRERVLVDKVKLLTEALVPMAIEDFRWGRGDFIEVQESQAEQLIQAGDAYLATPMGPAVGHVPYTTFTALPAYLAANHETAVHFTRAIARAQAWVAANAPTAIAALIAPEIPNVPLAILTTSVARYHSQNTWAAAPLIAPEPFYRLQTILRDGGLIKGQHRYEDHVATEYAHAAMGG